MKWCACGVFVHTGTLYDFVKMFFLLPLGREVFLLRVHLPYILGPKNKGIVFMHLQVGLCIRGHS